MGIRIYLTTSHVPFNFKKGLHSLYYTNDLWFFSLMFQQTVQSNDKARKAMKPGYKTF